MQIKYLKKTQKKKMRIESKLVNTKKKKIQWITKEERDKKATR